MRVTSTGCDSIFDEIDGTEEVSSGVEVVGEVVEASDVVNFSFFLVKALFVVVIDSLTASSLRTF